MLYLGLSPDYAIVVKSNVTGGASTACGTPPNVVNVNHVKSNITGVASAACGKPPVVPHGMAPGSYPPNVETAKQSNSSAPSTSGAANPPKANSNPVSQQQEADPSHQYFSVDTMDIRYKPGYKPKPEWNTLSEEERNYHQCMITRAELIKFHQPKRLFEVDTTCSRPLPMVD